MRLYKHSHPDRVLPFELTPMIDVVFLLIIFFMATAQYAKLSRAEVNLPREEGEQSQLSEEAGLVINITGAGQIIVGSESVTLSELRSVLNREMRQRQFSMTGMSVGGEAKVLLRADRDADSTVLNEVVAQLQQLGMGVARIATEVPSRTGGAR